MKEIVDRNNEITVRIKNSIKEINDILEKDGFKKVNDYHLEDSFFTEVDIKGMSVRDIIKSCVILRDYDCHLKEGKEYTLTKKHKEIDENGNIISQYSVNLSVKDKESGVKFLEAIGYKKIMTIVEDGYAYLKDGLLINTKGIQNGDNLMEIEENETFDSIEKIINELKRLNLDIDESDYFVKKAEVELSKIINE